VSRKNDSDDDAEADERERQERVIHTRISERLENELKERAASLGVSVSNLVRNVLDNAFELVEDIVADSARFASSATSGWRAAKNGIVGGVVAGAASASRAKPAAGDDIIGWQELVMNLNAVCSRCNGILPRGADAAIAIVHGSGDRPIVCLRCLEEIRHGSDPERSPDAPATGAGSGSKRER
jgi:hypothetical protein